MRVAVAPLPFRTIAPPFHVTRALTAVGCGALMIACSTHAPLHATVVVAPALLAPRALLTGVTRLTLAAYEAGDAVTCDPTTGRLSGVPDFARSLAIADLRATGCDPGVAFCGSLELTRAEVERAFQAVAFVDATEHALGCGKARVDQQAISLDLAMVRSVPPAVCGDGVLQPTEQCEPPGEAGDLTCDEACHTREVYLSGGSSDAGTAAGRPGDKARPALVWPSRTGRGGKLLAFFGDRSPPSQEITMRVLGDAMGPYREQGQTVQDASFFLPNTAGMVVGPAEANDQSNPAATFVGATSYVVFQDNNSPTGSPDIHLRSLDEGLQPGEGAGRPVGINGTEGGGETGIQALPAVAAGPGGVLLVAWQDESAGTIVGRTWDPQTRTVGAQRELSVGTTNRRVAVTGRPDGWALVWESGSDVKLRLLGASGEPTRDAFTVNGSNHRGAQEQPAVAALADGRFAVAWTDRGAAGGAEIYLQRYDAGGVAMPGDQDAPLDDVTRAGDQTQPALAASGNALVAAWVDDSAGHVHARYVNADGGFLFNPVTGQASEFQASVEESRTRAAPAIAVGGSGPFVAIAWEDRTVSGRPGIYARRFPVPTN